MSDTIAARPLAAWQTDRLTRITWFVIAAGVALRAHHLLAGPSMWSDEVVLMQNVLQFDAASLPFRRLDAHPSTQAAPPLYLWYLKFALTWFGRSDIILRLPAFLASVAALPLTMLVARRLAGPLAALLATALLAFSGNSVFQAYMVKPYSIDAAATLVLIWIGLVWKPASAWRRDALFAFTAAVLLWISFASVFAIAAVGAVMLLRAWPLGWRSRLQLCAWMLLPLASFLLLHHFCIRAQHDAYLADWWEDRFVPWSTPWKIPKWIWQGTYQAYVFACQPLGGVLLPLAVVGLVWAWKHARDLVLLACLFWLLSLAAAAAWRYPFGGTRVNLYLIPVQLMLAAIGIATIFTGISRWRPAVRTIVLAPIVAAIGLQCYELVNPRYFSFAKPAIAYIDAHRRPGEPLYVHPASKMVYLWYHPEPRPDVYLDGGDTPAMQADRCWLLLSYLPKRRSDTIKTNPIPDSYRIDPQQSWQHPGGEALLLVRIPSNH